MTSSRPYLIRALYEWIMDNRQTPHVLVDATYPGVRVPAGSVESGQIVLNINPSAVRHLEMNNEFIDFEARFSGNPTIIYLPIGSILGIYSRETGQGMVFEADIEPKPATEPEQRPTGRPQLKIVK